MIAPDILLGKVSDFVRSCRVYYRLIPNAQGVLAAVPWRESFALTEELYTGSLPFGSPQWSSPLADVAAYSPSKAGPRYWSDGTETGASGPCAKLMGTAGLLTLSGNDIGVSITSGSLILSGSSEDVYIGVGSVVLEGGDFEMRISVASKSEEQVMGGGSYSPLEADSVDVNGVPEIILEDGYAKFVPVVSGWYLLRCSFEFYFENSGYNYFLLECDSDEDDANTCGGLPKGVYWEGGIYSGLGVVCPRYCEAGNHYFFSVIQGTGAEDLHIFMLPDKGSGFSVTGPYSGS